MIPRRYLLMGLAAVLAILVALVGVYSCRKHDATQAETQSAIHQGEANAHASQAQAIPDHDQALAREKANSDRAWSEVRRLRAVVAAQTPGVPGPSTGPGPTVGEPAVDHRDELLAADRVLIDALTSENGELKLALSDECKRSSEFKAAFESERKATAAQQAATEAWKKAVATSRWRGRVEGFVAGAALGYLGGKR